MHLAPRRLATYHPALIPRAWWRSRSSPCSTVRSKKDLQLHTYSPALGAASPVVDAAIVKSDENGYGSALSVPNAPVTGALKITAFNAELFKDSKVAKAKCDPKEIKFLRQTVYQDGSSEESKTKQKCKVK